MSRMAIAIEREVAERGAASSVASPAGHCCCCCCCCLHTVGGVIGALTTAAPTAEGPALPGAQLEGATRAPRTSAHGLYWALTAIWAGLLCASAGARHDRVGEIALVLALFLPGAQLVAALSAAIVVSLSRRPGREARLGHVGRIAMRSFVGSLLGVLAMLVLAVVLQVVL